MKRTPEESERRRTWSGEDYPMGRYMGDEEEEEEKNKENDRISMS